MSDDAPAPALASRVMLFCCLVEQCEGLDLQSAGVAAGGLGRSPPQVITGIQPGVIVCALGTTLLGWRVPSGES